MGASRPPRRLALAALGVVVLVALGLHVVVAVGDLRRLRSGFRLQEGILAHVVAERVRIELTAARLLAESVELRGLPADREEARSWLARQRRLHDLYSAVGLRVVDRQGRTLAGIGRYAEHTDHGRDGVTVCRRCLENAHALIVAGQPDPEHVVEVVLSLDRLSARALAPVSRMKGGLAWLVGPSGTVLGSLDPAQLGTRPFVGSSVDPALSAMLAALERGGSGEGDFRWGGGDRLAAFAPVDLPEPRMGVVVWVDRARVDRELWSGLASLGAAGLALLLAVGWMLALLARERSARWAAERSLYEARLAASRALAHQERLALIGTMSAGVAHDLRGPLTVLGFAAEELAAGPPDPELLGMVRDAVASLRLLAEDLTGFARSSPAGEARCRAGEAVASALRLAAPRLRSGPELVVEGLDELPEVSIDRSRLGQVVLNLVFNAAQATGPEGTIRVMGDAVDGGARLVVEDDGPGLPPELSGRLFEPFTTTRPEGEGTGLGLYLARRMVEEAGGELHAADRQGGGARFEVWLPGFSESRPGSIQAQAG